MWCDSKSAISIVKNPDNHNANKHIEIGYLFTRELCEKERLRVEYCKTDEMSADALTKALGTKQFEKLRDKIGVRDVSLTDRT